VNELIFLVDEAPGGGYTARALGAPLFTEADDLDSLREQIRDAVRFHFDTAEPAVAIRLRFIPAPAMHVPGLNSGAIWISDDFDEPLPDDFWAGCEPTR
jgi:hypothetical protein